MITGQRFNLKKSLTLFKYYNQRPSPTSTKEWALSDIFPVIIDAPLRKEIKVLEPENN